MYVYVIHSDHFSVTSLRDSTFFWFLFLYNILIHNWTNWPLLSRSRSVLLAEAQEEVERTSWTQQHVTLHVENRLYISVQSIHSFTLNVFELFLSLTVSPLWWIILLNSYTPCKPTGSLMDWSASFLGVSSQKYRLWYSAHRLITHVEALLPLLSVSLKNSSSSSSRRFSFLMSSPASVPAAVFFSPQGELNLISQNFLCSVALPHTVTLPQRVSLAHRRDHVDPVLGQLSQLVDELLHAGARPRVTVQVVPQDERALHQQLQLHQVTQPVEAQQVFLRFSTEKPEGQKTTGGRLLSYGHFKADGAPFKKARSEFSATQNKTKDFIHVMISSTGSFNNRRPN